MHLSNIFKHDETVFYIDSLEVLIGLKKSLKDCYHILQSSTIDNYNEVFDICASTFDKISEIIDDFIKNWEKDEDKICSTLNSSKDYIEYYIRLCDSSTEKNYKANMKYMIDSIDTILLVFDSKINYINNEKLKNNLF